MGKVINDRMTRLMAERFSVESMQGKFSIVARVFMPRPDLPDSTPTVKSLDPVHAPWMVRYLGRVRDDYLASLKGENTFFENVLSLTTLMSFAEVPVGGGIRIDGQPTGGTRGVYPVATAVMVFSNVRVINKKVMNKGDCLQMAEETVDRYFKHLHLETTDFLVVRPQAAYMPRMAMSTYMSTDGERHQRSIMELAEQHDMMPITAHGFDHSVCDHWSKR